MKPHESSSKLGLLLSVVLLVGGVFLIAHPIDLIVGHPNMLPRGNTETRFATPTEHITPARSKLYGVGLVVFGLALGAFSLYRPRG